MESKEVKFVNGHLYDIKSKLRLELIPGIQYTIIGERFDKPKEESKVSLRNTNDIIDELTSLKKSGEIDSYGIIANRGDQFSFYINPKGMSKEHHFSVKLLEDLFYKKSHNYKSKEIVTYSCRCVVTENTNNTLEFFEPIYANSISELFKKTYVHYFGNHGSPSANALDRFYIDGNSKKTLRELYKEKKAP